ncbi:MAG: hypothetical protein Q4C34_04725 [Bacteroidales bacterium]|nr:hypothetical protein [Bacteroidales bacterium]
MDPNAQPDPRRELCDRFRADLSKPLSERYYSEDDLIEIFDYAGDVNDDYLRAEALMLGARLYPDSSELTERRAIFYMFFDEQVFRKYLADHSETHTPMWEILRLNLLTPGTDETRSELETFLDNAGDLGDEEIIQFVQLASTLKLNEWLYQNVDRLRSHCSYLPTLLYELAVNAEMADDYEQAAQFLNELTEIEPYNSDYWTMLATDYLLLGRKADAATAVDYALAINPDYIDALKVRLGTIENSDMHGEFGELVDRILAADPTAESVAYMVVERSINIGETEYAHSVLKRVAGHIKDSYRLVEKALESKYPGTRFMLEDLYDSGQNDRDEWINLADAAWKQGDMPAASFIMQLYEDRSGESLGHDVLSFHILYRLHHYDLVTYMFGATDENSPVHLPENLYITHALYIMSELRLGNIDSAEELANDILKLFNSAPDFPGDEFHKFAMCTFLSDVIARIHDDKPTDWQTYDPLGLD